MSLVIDKLKYLVINSRFTANLIVDKKMLKEMKKELKERNEGHILYIEDGPNYFLEVSKRKNSIKRVRKALKYAGYEKSGVIVLSTYDIGEVIRQIQTVSEFKYCSMFSINGITSMELMDEDILVVTFDTERG